jgi:ATP-dependent Clp protease ATP-binding subunit ClpA/CheY-like chemotaxis protein
LHATEDQQNPQDASVDLIQRLASRVIGQPSALKYIVPYVQMYQAGLAPEGRPVGVFLLLGPSGTGKTKTVEALAEILHGSESKVIKLDCGEFQMEHEVARLIGAPPGYVGHRETQPMLTQDKLRDASSEQSDLAIILFDEIEKAAHSLTRLLLGILDRATLRLGDGTTVNFEKTLIFFTSNLGAREMLKELRPGFGFHSEGPPKWPELKGRLESIALAAVRKMYSPEFVNRIDCVITYQPLDKDSFQQILNQQIEDLQRHVNTRLGGRCFNIEISEESREFLLQKGTSPEYGARELKRTIHRHVTQPLATMVIKGKIEPGALVKLELATDREGLKFEVTDSGVTLPARPTTILIVDDSSELLHLLSIRLQTGTAWRILTAETVSDAEASAAVDPPDLSLLDFMLPDGDGVRLGVGLRRRFPQMQCIVMSGAELPPEEQEICRQYDFPTVQKPFLADYITHLIRARLGPSESRGLTIGH